MQKGMQVKCKFCGLEREGTLTFFYSSSTASLSRQYLKLYILSRKKDAYTLAHKISFIVVL